jgi:hypothetical protein
MTTIGAISGKSIANTENCVLMAGCVILFTRRAYQSRETPRLDTAVYRNQPTTPRTPPPQYHTADNHKWHPKGPVRE